MPDGRSLEEHLLTVAEGLTALGAASAGRMKVVVIACLEHLDKINKIYLSVNNRLHAAAINNQSLV